MFTIIEMCSQLFPAIISVKKYLTVFIASKKVIIIQVVYGQNWAKVFNYIILQLFTTIQNVCVISQSLSFPVQSACSNFLV